MTTQCYVKGEAMNDKDGIYRSIRGTKQRDAVTIDFAPIAESKIGELSARFDVIIDFTPEM